MGKLTKTGYVIISTRYTIDGQIHSVETANCIFTSLKKAQEWIMSTKGKGLLNKSVKYAKAHDMSVEFSKINDDELNYLIEVIDGDKKYPSIQYTVVPIKYLARR